MGHWWSSSHKGIYLWLALKHRVLPRKVYRIAHGHSSDSKNEITKDLVKYDVMTKKKISLHTHNKTAQPAE